MRAVFNCEKEVVQKIATSNGLDKLNLALHEESDDKESIVSGDVNAVMLLVGAMAFMGNSNLDECWSYEC